MLGQRKCLFNIY